MPLPTESDLANDLQTLAGYTSLKRNGIFPELLQLLALLRLGSGSAGGGSATAANQSTQITRETEIRDLIESDIIPALSNISIEADSVNLNTDTLESLMAAVRDRLSAPSTTRTLHTVTLSSPSTEYSTADAVPPIPNLSDAKQVIIDNTVSTGDVRYAYVSGHAAALLQPYRVVPVGFEREIAGAIPEEIFLAGGGGNDSLVVLEVEA